MAGECLLRYVKLWIPHPVQKLKTKASPVIVPIDWMIMPQCTVNLLL